MQSTVHVLLRESAFAVSPLLYVGYSNFVAWGEVLGGGGIATWVDLVPQCPPTDCCGGIFRRIGSFRRSGNQFRRTRKKWLGRELDEE